MERAIGDGRLQALELRDTATDTGEAVPAQAMSVFIGAVPPTDRLKGSLESLGMSQTALRRWQSRPR